MTADVALQKRSQAKNNANIWDWAMTSDSNQVVFLSSKTFSNNHFPKDVVCALRELLAFLAGQGIVDPHVEWYKVFRP